MQGDSDGVIYHLRQSCCELTAVTESVAPYTQTTTRLRASTCKNFFILSSNGFLVVFLRCICIFFFLLLLFRYFFIHHTQILHSGESTSVLRVTLTLNRGRTGRPHPALKYQAFDRKSKFPPCQWPWHRHWNVKTKINRY